MNPRPLPTLDPPSAPSEPVLAHGARVLRFLCATGVTATLTDHELERAAYAARFAIAARGLSVPGADALGDVLHRIARTLAARAAEQPRQGEQAPSARPFDTRPNDGPMARLTPRPQTQPPAPVRQVVPIDF